MKRDCWGCTPTAGIFISYRRDDTAPWAGRLYEHLAVRYFSDQIFMDVDKIAPGADFVKEVERQVGACDVLIAMIGKEWTDARNDMGERRLDNPDDFVRIELATALARDIWVIPVLVDGASMPRSEELPNELRSLVRRQAVILTHDRFGSDVQLLANALAPIIKRSGQLYRLRRYNSWVWWLLLRVPWRSIILFYAIITTLGAWVFWSEPNIPLAASVVCSVASPVLWYLWYYLRRRNAPDIKQETS